MAFCWRADGGPTLNAGLVAFVGLQGIRTSIAKKPYIFVILEGVQTPCPPPPHLDPHIYRFPQIVAAKFVFPTTAKLKNEDIIHFENVNEVFPKMGLDARKPVSGDLRTTRHRPACASTQSDQHICYLLIEKYATSVISLF